MLLLLLPHLCTVSLICSRKLQATKTQEMKFLAMRITWLLEKTVHATIKYFLGFKRMLIQLLRGKKENYLA